jgi:hypothetical protein
MKPKLAIVFLSCVFSLTLSAQTKIISKDAAKQISDMVEISDSVYHIIRLNLFTLLNDQF